ncbi:MAG: 30S ribosomal protein S27ae [Nanoarchaeota archaeon]
MSAKKVVKKGKKPHKNKPTSKKYSKYKIDGEKITREKFCPRCGPGVFLMNSQGRLYCGKCHYSEFEGKKKEEVKEEKKE